MSADESPPAFPSVCLSDPGHPSSVPGLSKREWFAGMALPTVISVCAGDTEARKLGPEIHFANKAFQIADAMIAAGKNGGDQ